MTTIAISTVVTAILGREFHYARTTEEINEIIDAVLATPHSQVYAWDRPCRESSDGASDEFPPHRLRISTHPGGWASVNYHDGTPEHQDLADSYNPTTEDTPSLLFDPEGDLWFPASASLPLVQARQAIAEYCRTGQRPGCIHWQLGQWI
ncbi:Immunity protein Imm1 [Actinopolyspora mzabensis]|uniref:Immunity protein Imm1 n=1 Tax=Actinopolyspora mzabensis TaxID=995066 RepID=A0A1G9AR45_ACTMZ|nr:Imm1 family immunity protein [Actinopolyspora mzabensis]SDK29701.1 Immunity protein Imm1 [Actinopolyspora mzabensis]